MQEPEHHNSEQIKGPFVASAAWYVPTLYFVEGLPYTMVTMMSVVLLKNLNFDNSVIGFATSILYIPWTVKFLWGPLVDLYATRRKWILASHTVLTVLSAILALVVLCSAGLPYYLGVLLLIALASATQDIAIDGFYMEALNESAQAFYVGVRNATYKMAWLFGSGILVYLAGLWTETQGRNDLKGIAQGWSVSFSICAAVLLLARVWHGAILPHPKTVASEGQKPEARDASQLIGQFKNVFLSFLNQPRIAAVILYILIFRMGDALMLKMAQPFLLDPSSKGGLAITTAQVGLIYGTIGVACLLMGGLAGGALVAKYGLKRCLLPVSIVQNCSILLYWLLAVNKPGVTMVAVVNALEQFAYGFGVSAFTVFLLTVVKAEYRAAHYAIATGLMAIGLVLPGAISGFLVDWLGYQNFFLLSFFVSIPGIICILFLPLRQPGVTT